MKSNERTGIISLVITTSLPTFFDKFINVSLVVLGGIAIINTLMVF